MLASTTGKKHTLQSLTRHSIATLTSSSLQLKILIIKAAAEKDYLLLSSIASQSSMQTHFRQQISYTSVASSTLMLTRTHYQALSKQQHLQILSWLGTRISPLVVPGKLNLRDVSRWLELCHSSPKNSPVSHISTVVLQRFRTVKQVDVMHGALRSVFPEDTQESFYTRLGPHALQIGTAVLDRDPIHQHVPADKHIRVSQLPQARSIITAITRSWPVVLAGSSGSGKSWLLRFLAAASGSKLVEISMNVDTDTSDLVGGFEQYDEQREIQHIKQMALETINIHLEDLLAQEPGVGDHYGTSRAPESAYARPRRDCSSAARTEKLTQSTVEGLPHRRVGVYLRTEQRRHSKVRLERWSPCQCNTRRRLGRP